MESSNDLNWDEFLNVNLMSLDDERNTSAQVSSYMLKNNNNINIDVSAEPLNEEIFFIYSFDKLKHNTKFVENWITRIEQTNSRSIYPGEHFPDIENINEFIFLVYELSSLPLNLLSKSYFTDEWLITSLNHFEESTFDLIDALTYFGIVHYKEEDYDNKYFFSDIFKKMANENPEDKYLEIIKIICMSKTCKELLTIQNYTNFDNMTKSIMIDKLLKDPNIIENRKTHKQINKIINNFRNWFLDINKILSLKIS
ncbi:hypothetical protein AB4027_06345 [Alkalibacterium putridalgicola]|uniref:hypothetical protein n=1 Tax=Alkalibacterium putridalgicola TaxID=426703 RepID=UPI0034CDD830